MPVGVVNECPREINDRAHLQSITLMRMHVILGHLGIFEFDVFFLAMQCGRGFGLNHERIEKKISRDN